MATVVGDIAIKVGADIGPLVTNLGRAAGAVTAFGRGAEASAVGMRIATVAGTALGIAALAASAGLMVLTKNSMANIDAMSKAASAMDIHTASLQAMAQVANEAGISTDGLTKAMVKMLDNIAGLQQGTAAQVTAFGQMGMALNDLAGLGADEQFALIAEHIAAIGDPAERTAAALNVFGKAGADLLPMFDGYKAALIDVTKFQNEFGISVSDMGGKDVEAANDALGRISIAMSGLGNMIAVSFSPAIVEAANALVSLLSALHKTDEEITGMAIDLSMDKVSESADKMYYSATRVATSLAGVQFPEIATKIESVADALDKNKKAFDDGSISADLYEERLAFLKVKLSDLYIELSRVSGADFSPAVLELDRLADAISRAFDVAKRLAGVLPTLAAPAGPTDMAADAHGGRAYAPSGLAPTSSIRPGQRGVDFGFGGTGSSGGGGGGGGGPNPLIADLAAIRESFQSEQEQADAQYAERLAKLEEFRQAKMVTEAEFDELEKAARTDHTKAIADIEQNALEVKLSAISGAFGDLASLMQSNNEKTFKIGKAAALASAIIDGYSAATTAWNKGMQIGGPFAAAAFTAASLAKTGMLISNISRTQMNGSSVGAAGGGSAGTGAASAPSAPLEVRLTGFGPSDMFTGGMIGSLLDKLSDEAGDRGYKIMVAA